MKLDIFQNWPGDISVYENGCEKWIEANSAFSLVGLLSYKQKSGLKVKLEILLISSRSFHFWYLIHTTTTTIFFYY